MTMDFEDMLIKPIEKLVKENAARLCEDWQACGVRVNVMTAYLILATSDSTFWQWDDFSWCTPWPCGGWMQ